MFKPMKGATVTDVKALRFPLLGSPKLDGYRASIQNGQLWSKNLKLIRNRHTQALFSDLFQAEGMDGELIVGDPTHPDCFRRTSSGVTSIEGEPDVALYVFDTHSALPYTERLRLASHLCDGKRLRVVHHTMIKSVEELRTYQLRQLALGYEGVMLRHPSGPYKEGESTLNEGWLMKLKEFDYDDAEVLEVIELQHNTNTAKTNALGHTERSSAKAGMVGGAAVGGFRVRGLTGPYKGCEFNVARGVLTAEQCAYLWTIKDSLVGHVIEYKFFPLGSKEAPRFPTYFGPQRPGVHTP